MRENKEERTSPAREKTERTESGNEKHHADEEREREGEQDRKRNFHAVLTERSAASVIRSLSRVIAAFIMRTNDAPVYRALSFHAFACESTRNIVDVSP